ncbi:hypothetical protein BV22DRAFT_569506 [Leucogyrophana mollusca]|uniref:Uncharacterized protein n=1 Tax=Leucogyrophana mollusca TaxID=85980 RepID=A0ACB8BEB6_9AGAM|nr:hypothetical protein BV22DRAFT_569506 [Leucogyrophana mollusca]
MVRTCARDKRNANQYSSEGEVECTSSLTGGWIRASRRSARDMLRVLAPLPPPLHDTTSWSLIWDSNCQCTYLCCPRVTGCLCLIRADPQTPVIFSPAVHWGDVYPEDKVTILS